MKNQRQKRRFAEGAILRCQGKAGALGRDSASRADAASSAPTKGESRSRFLVASRKKHSSLARNDS